MADDQTITTSTRQRLAPWFLLGLLMIAGGVWAAIWWSTRPQAAALATGRFVAGSQEGTPVTAGPDGTVWIHLSGPQYAITHDAGKTYAEVDVLPGGASASTANAAWSVPVFDPSDSHARAVASLDANGHIAISGDGGKTWRVTKQPALHGAVRSLVVRFGGKWLYAASGSVVARSVDFGRSWKALVLPKKASGIAAFFSIPAAPKILLAASPTTGIWRTTNGGQSWVHVQRPAGGTGAAFISDPASAKRLWVVVGGQLYASEDAGATFGATSARGVTILARDANSRRVFALTSDGAVLASADGAHWGQIARDAEPGSLVASWGTLYGTVKGKIATLADRG